MKKSFADLHFSLAAILILSHSRSKHTGLSKYDSAHRTFFG